VAGAFAKPNGILVNSNSPSGVTKAVFLAVFLRNWYLHQYPLARTNVEKYFAPASL
jgi:hypothetical protein